MPIAHETAGVLSMTIDEEGMAHTRDRKPGDCPAHPRHRRQRLPDSRQRIWCSTR
ncbi:MAG: hypothetical protein U0521_10360 [Anaerolineae bacterium]